MQIDEPAIIEKETTDQKFRRLKLEIEELVDLVENGEKVIFLKFLLYKKNKFRMKIHFQ